MNKWKYKEQPQPKDLKWKLVGHSHQIADTGDYDGCYEITDGKVSIFTKDDNEKTLQPIVDAFNEADCKFYLDDSTEFELHLAKLEIEQLKNQSEQPSVDVKRWYQLLLGKGEKAMREDIQPSPLPIIDILKDFFYAGYDYRSSLIPEIIEEFGEDSKPDFKTFLQSKNVPLIDKGEELDKLKNILREFIMRGNYGFPMNEQDLKWFETGIKGTTKEGADFLLRLFKISGIEAEVRDDEDLQIIPPKLDSNPLAFYSPKLRKWMPKNKNS